MAVAPEAVVDPPATTPPLHSLLSSGVVVNETSDRWEAGFTFQPENCIEAEVWAPCPECRDLIIQAGICATAGTFEISWDGSTTGPLAFNISAADLQTALEGLPQIAPGDITVTGGPGDATASTPYIFTYSGPFLETWCQTRTFPDPMVTADVSLLTGGTCTTPGVSGEVAVIQVPNSFIKKEYDGNQDDVTVQPYVLEVPYTCSSFGFQAANYEKRARRQLEAAKHKALENEFWTGWSNPANPSLMGSTPNDDTHVLNPGGAAEPVAVSPGIALTLFAQALANCGTGGRGMIHATPALVERWVSLASVHCDEKLITTCARGDIIVNGSGYLGWGPVGQPLPAANTVWAYATGIVDIRMGEVEIYPKEFSEALDRATNTVTYRGEVTAAAAHDLCCTFAVLVDLCTGL